MHRLRVFKALRGSASLCPNLIEYRAQRSAERWTAGLGIGAFARAAAVRAAAAPTSEASNKRSCPCVRIWRESLPPPKNGHTFRNGLYERYSGFNKFELVFAGAMDKVGLPWHRNPSSGGFYIPLLSEGDTSSFYPDFIVWKKNLIYCLDTKGGHLLSDAVARKLFDIKEDGKTKVLVRFITEGKQSELRGKAIKGGYTVWKMKSGSPTPVHVDDLNKAVTECLR